MNPKIFIQEGKWLPSFSLFGRGELIVHTPIHNEKQSSQIKTVLFNPTYPTQHQLAKSLSRQLYSLVKELSTRSASPCQVKISHLCNMMQSIVKISDNNAQSYHNIIYLTVKYLAYVVTQQAKQNEQQLEDQVTLRSWLSDIHSIYYHSLSQQKLQGMTEEEQLLFLFKRGKYQQIVPIIRSLYCKLDEKDTNGYAKLDVILTVLLLKMYDQPDNTNQTKAQKTVNRKKKIQSLRNKFSKASQSSKSKTKADNIQIIGEVLFGKESSIQNLAQGSWPLYIMNLANLEDILADGKLGEITENANKFIKKYKNYGKSTESETQYLLSLLAQPNLHSMYQSLQALIPPFYCHFLAYLFDLISPDPLPNIIVQDYFTDIVRNLLFHASQISFQALIYNVAVLQESNVIERRNQIYQPLFYHHLIVIDPEDKVELNDFLRKLKILQAFHLQGHASFQLNSLLQKLLQNGVLTRQTFLIYAYCSIFFKSYYNYQQLLSYHLEEIYSTFQFKIDFLFEYQNLKREMIQQKNRAILNELTQIEPLLQKFYLYQKITTQKNKHKNQSYFLQLMQKTYRSLRLLQLISDRVYKATISLSRMSEYEQNHEEVYFLKNVKQFLMHYPSECSQKQRVLIHLIDGMIG